MVFCVSFGIATSFFGLTKLPIWAGVDLFMVWRERERERERESWEFFFFFFEKEKKLMSLWLWLWLWFVNLWLWIWFVREGRFAFSCDPERACVRGGLHCQNATWHFTGRRWEPATTVFCILLLPLILALGTPSKNIKHKNSSSIFKYQGRGFWEVRHMATSVNLRVRLRIYFPIMVLYRCHVQI